MIGGNGGSISVDRLLRIEDMIVPHSMPCPRVIRGGFSMHPCGTYCTAISFNDMLGSSAAWPASAQATYRHRQVFYKIRSRIFSRELLSSAWGPMVWTLARWP